MCGLQHEATHERTTNRYETQVGNLGEEKHKPDVVETVSQHAMLSSMDELQVTSVGTCHSL